jgi:aspartate aminotransferase
MALLALPPEHYTYVRETFQRRRDVLLEGLRSIPGVTCASSQGAFYLMPELPIEDSDDFAKWMLECFDMHNTTVMVAPGTGFFTQPEKGKRLVRIAYVLEENLLEQAVEILRVGLNIYNREHTAVF